MAVAHHESATIKLESGNHIILFTDGIIEAFNPEGQEFGMDRLTELPQANARSTDQEIVNRLRVAVLSFSARSPRHNDITMMVPGFRKLQG
jgi:serine phosphatase RsbU (regulator of sigma subunit)